MGVEAGSQGRYRALEQLTKVQFPQVQGKKLL
jgi:hypothetical protein